MVKPDDHPGKEQLQHPQVAGLGHAEHQVERSDQTDHRLPEVLLARAHALGVLVHHLAPVVHPADGAKAQRDQQHDPHEAVGQVEPEDGGDRDREQDQHTAHGGRAALADVGLHRVFANRLADLQRSQAANEIRTGDQAHEQRGERGHDGAKRQVLEHPQETEFGRQALQPEGQARQHGRCPSCCCLVRGPAPARRSPHARCA